ncbi:hypothetical protein Metbo_1470 [Methanobacterium lacus]|uniref:DUF4013 domain-containing protein n=1 Tax=Methanobacterium lacus (strain AL-21) TaxID=877455 RepID=F0T8F5_METLA|nr:DUF4013 domain-containing protein [Methanobacterium lacus]ADZ09706.1 hypothetical protein Metbo_1470 [Methanobacterium lacus]
MKIGEIVKDSLKYPFSDWKKFLIFGILVMFNSLNAIFQSLGMDRLLISMLGIIGLLFGVLVFGYEIRILKLSLNGVAKLPPFNDWFDIIINGIFVIVVAIAYSIPLIMILMFGGLSLGLTIGSIGTNGATIFLVILIAIIFLYLIIISPIFLMSLANMAFYNDDLGAAFKFRDIFYKISNIGWGNLIIWYITIAIICMGILFLGAVIEVFFNLIGLKVIGVVLIPLIVLPYLSIYIFRSVALFYLSEDQGFLECEKCGGYYELQPGESLEDFEKCQCGGELKYNKQPDKRDNRSFIENLKSLNKKQGLIIVGILALIIGMPFIFAQHMPQHIITTNSTLIGTYNVSNLNNPNSVGTFVVIPPGTTNIKVEYNLSWTPAKTGANGFDITGYNTNITGWDSLPDNKNVIYNKGISLFENGQNKTGTLNLDGNTIRSLVISGNGVNGTVKIYAIKTKFTLWS